MDLDFIPLALSILPFGNAIREGSMVGAGPDVVKFCVGYVVVPARMEQWCLGWTLYIFNFPWGGQGAYSLPDVCSGLVYVGWCFGTCLGNNGHDVAYVGQNNAWHGLFGTIAFRLNKIALGAMMLMCLLPRYIIFTLGETGVVGVAMMPLLVGLGLIVQLERMSMYLVGFIDC